MKIAFFGTWEFSKNILAGILQDSSVIVDLVVSQPDKPIGRKKIITPTPIKLLAATKDIEVLQPEKLKNNTDFFEILNSRQLDFIVVVAYGKIVPTEVLEAPKYGCINIHGSILPAYRGASPIQEAIKNGNSKTWLTIMYMSEGMDEWDILKIQEVDIDMLDKTPNIFEKFEQIWPKLLLDTLNGILDGSIEWIPQNDSEATYCSKIEKSDALVSFQKDLGQDIYNKYRSYYPWPGIHSHYNDKKITIEDCIFEKRSLTEDIELGTVLKTENKNIAIICEDWLLILKQVKLEGKKSMDILSFINGNKDFLNYKFD